MSREDGPRALTVGCGMLLLSAALGGGAGATCAARADSLDQSSSLAHELDGLVVSAMRDVWGVDWIRPHAAIADLPPRVMAMTRRWSASECFIVFDEDARWWPAEVRESTAVHEVAHCLPVFYPVAGGLSEHNPDPASVMFSEYRAGQSILASDRAAVRPERVVVAGVAR